MIAAEGLTGWRNRVFSWAFLFLLSRIMFWAMIACVVINSWHFLSQRIPIGG